MSCRWLFVVLMTLASIAAPLWAADGEGHKTKGTKREKLKEEGAGDAGDDVKAKDEKGRDRGKKAEKDGEGEGAKWAGGGVGLEVAYERAAKVCPELLAVREGVDRLFTRYAKLQSTLGTKETKLAQREAPGVRKELEKGLEKLKVGPDQAVVPYERSRKDLKRKEGELIKQVSRLEKGNRPADKQNKELEKLGDELTKVEESLEVVREIGTPEMSLARCDHMVLYALLHPDERQEPVLQRFIVQSPKLLEARIQIEQLHADLETAGVAGEGKEAKDAVAKIEAELDRVKEEFKKEWDKVNAQYAEELRTLKAQEAELSAIAEKSQGKPAGTKARQQLDVVTSRLDGLAPAVDMLKLLNKLDKRPVFGGSDAGAAPEKPDEGKAKPGAGKEKEKDGGRDKPRGGKAKAGEGGEKPEADK